MTITRYGVPPMKKDQEFVPLQQAINGAEQTFVAMYGVMPPAAWPDPGPPPEWPRMPMPSPFVQRPEREFRCAKCESTKVDVKYSKGKLECKCTRCKHNWKEIPSDAVNPILKGTSK